MKSTHIAAAAALVGLVAGLGLGLSFATPGVNLTSTTTVDMTVLQNSVLVSDPSPYFATHLSKTVSMAGVSDGYTIDVGQSAFRLVVPSNIETRTTQHSGTTTVVTVTADYQCGISLGQRMFFDAKLPDNMTARLDYCLILNNAVQLAQRSGNLSMGWSLWQIPLGTYPVVALHMSGTGEQVGLVELWSSD